MAAPTSQARGHSGPSYTTLQDSTPAPGVEGEEPELVVAFHRLSPAAVEVDPETGNVQLVEEPYGEDPLGDAVGAGPLHGHDGNGEVRDGPSAG